MASLKKPNQSVQRKGTPPKETEASNNLTVYKEEIASQRDIRPLNFKVDNGFRKRFKNFATNNDMTMSDLLVRCFEEFVKAKKE